MKNEYDVAAYIWPSYTGHDKRAYQFWEKGIGEWQTVQTAKAKFEGHDWPRKPLWGYLDEADPSVMEMQIEQAVSHGVNVFIYDWYWYDNRPFLENCLNEGFLQAKNRNKMKFYLMWANHDANYLWDKRLSSVMADTVVWKGVVSDEIFDKMTDRIIEKYFSEPNYYQIDGCPVFMIYDIENLVTSFGGVDNTKVALDKFRQKTKAAGYKGLHLQFVGWNGTVVNFSKVDSERTFSLDEFLKLMQFDSITFYQYVHIADVNKDYCEVLKDVEKVFDKMATLETTCYPHASIGWDNNPRFDAFMPNIMKNSNPQNFEKGLRLAKDYADKHLKGRKLITINSWNEWTESSYLEPDDLNGYGYLDAVKRVFCDEK